MAKKKELISPEEAERQGFAVPQSDLQWGKDEFKIPKKKAIGYKLFAIFNNDLTKLYPPVVANPEGQPTPIGEWIPCSSPPIEGYTVKEHRPQVKTGGKGTARNLGNLSFRPGWHLGVVPYAPQFQYKNGNKEKLIIDGKVIMPSNFVFAKCEYQADSDFSEESYQKGLTKKGKYQHARAGLPRIPKNGYYRYRTNPDPSSADWIITGAIKVISVLTPKQVDNLNKKEGLPGTLWMSNSEVKKYKKQLKTIQQESFFNRKLDLIIQESINKLLWNKNLL